MLITIFKIPANIAKNSTDCSLDKADNWDGLLSVRCFDCLSSGPTSEAVPSATKSTGLLDIGRIYEGRSVNKLQNDTILLIFKR